MSLLTLSAAPTGSVLTQDQWNQQNPGMIVDPNGGGYTANTATYNDYLNSLPDNLKNTHDYAAYNAQQLAGNVFNAFSQNGKGYDPNQVANWNQQIDAYKNVAPDAYYFAKLQEAIGQAGWDAGQGKSNPNTNAQIQSLANEALSSGALTQSQVNNLLGNYQAVAQGHAANIANRATTEGTLNGIQKIAPAFAAMITAGALAPAAGALEAAGGTALGETGAGSIDAYLASAGMNPGTFEGASAIGGITSSPTTDAMIQFANASPDPIQALTELQSMTPEELSAALGPGATNGLTAKDVLSYANKARQALNAGNTLAKLVGGGSSMVGGSSGVNTSALAKALQQSSTGPTSFTQMNMNQSPFLQAQQPTSVQNTPNKQYDFLAELAKEGQTQPTNTLANLVRTA